MLCSARPSLTSQAATGGALLKKGVFKIFCKFYRKGNVLEYLFNKVEGVQACNFVKKRLQHRIRKILKGWCLLGDEKR